MRFATRLDGWLVAVLIFAAAVSAIALPLLRVLAPGPWPTPLWVSFVPWPIWILALASTLPQFYELRQEGLFIRQGWRRITRPYASLVEVQSVSSALSAPVFSTRRLKIAALDGRTILIAVAEEERFLAELARRAPQLERRGFGLAIATGLRPPSA